MAQTALRHCIIRMKTEVKFPISNPIAFTTEVSYEHLGVTTCIEAGKLAALKTVVEHDITAGTAISFPKPECA